MRPTLGIFAIFGSSLALFGPAQAQQCTVPNAIANGQVADATKVMDNFNAVAACVDSARSDAVTHEGTPIAGEIAVFDSATGITGGDLTGDVTTFGGTATTLSATGVAPNTYSNPTITVDAKGRITAATSGSGGSGAGGWAVIYSNNAISNPTPYVDIDVTGFGDAMVIGRGVTSASSGYRGVYLSVDGGNTFFKTNGNYEAVAANGTLNSVFLGLNHNTSTSSARSFGGVIHGLNIAGTPKLMENVSADPDRMFVGSYQPITHIRIAVIAASGGTEINMTGGEIFVLAR